MALAIIGGMPERFAPFAELHRAPREQAGHARPALSINSHGYIADDVAGGRRRGASRRYAAMMNRIGRERGWPPMTREQFEPSRTLRGANFVGSPQEVDREDPLPARDLRPRPLPAADQRRHAARTRSIMRSIELLGTEVAPVVRRELASTVAERSGAM